MQSFSFAVSKRVKASIAVIIQGGNLLNYALIRNKLMTPLVFCILPFETCCYITVGHVFFFYYITSATTEIIIRYCAIMDEATRRLEIT